MSPVRYELGFYIPEDDILHSHRREIFKSHKVWSQVSGFAWSHGGSACQTLG
jgi:hypothetical protein